MNINPLLLAALLPLCGCGAARSMYYLWDAERELQEAINVNAPQKAVYEYTLAREYLLKAKEEAGYSDYQASEKMARKAIEWAARASEVAQYGTTERDLLIEEMDEVPEEAPKQPRQEDILPHEEIEINTDE